MNGNLVRVWESATPNEIFEGRAWYTIANSAAANLGRRFGMGIKTSAGVIAALSPGREWSKNLEDAEVFMESWRAGNVPLVGTYGWSNVHKAEAIANGVSPVDILKGPKVTAFYNCIVNPRGRDHVCIDRHAASALLGRPLLETELRFTPKQYAAMAAEYLKTASFVGLRPGQFQAVIWVTWKRMKAGL